MSDQEIQTPIHPAELLRLGLERVARADSAELALRQGAAVQTSQGSLGGAPLEKHLEHLRATAGTLVLAGLVGVLVDEDNPGPWELVFDYEAELEDEDDQEAQA